MRRIFLDRLHVQASVGILEHELRAKQPLFISVVLELNNVPILPTADDVTEVLDYRCVRDIALQESSGTHINMLETLAGRICMRLQALSGVTHVRVRVDKPNIFPDCDGVAVEVEQNIESF